MAELERLHGAAGEAPWPANQPALLPRVLCTQRACAAMTLAHISVAPCCLTHTPANQCRPAGGGRLCVCGGQPLPDGHRQPGQGQGPVPPRSAVRWGGGAAGGIGAEAGLVGVGLLEAHVRAFACHACCEREHTALFYRLYHLPSLPPPQPTQRLCWRWRRSASATPATPRPGACWALCRPRTTTTSRPLQP